MRSAPECKEIGVRDTLTGHVATDRMGDVAGTAWEDSSATVAAAVVAAHPQGGLRAEEELDRLESIILRNMLERNLPSGARLRALWGQIEGTPSAGLAKYH